MVWAKVVCYGLPSCFREHPADPVGGDLLGADGFALQVAATATKALGRHGRLHGAGAAGPFGLPLGQLGQVSQLGGHKQTGRGIAAAGHTGAAADAGGRVEGRAGLLLAHQDGVGLRRLARAHRAVAAGDQQPIEGTALHRQALDQGKRPRPPGLQGEGGAVGKLAQVELADAGGSLGPVGLAVHQEAAAAADALAALVLEARRPLTGGDQLFVEPIEGLQQREVGAHALQPVALEAARGLGSLLSPDA